MLGMVGLLAIKRSQPLEGVANNANSVSGFMAVSSFVKRELVETLQSGTSFPAPGGHFHLNH